MKLKKWIFLGLLLGIFYYIFIVNIFITLFIIVSLVVAFKLYKFYSRKKLNNLLDSTDKFNESQLGLFIALVAKVAKADGRVDELEAQLIGIMFDDLSKLFDDKEKARTLMKNLFNKEKNRDDNTSKIAQSLNQCLGKSILKRKQFVSFLVQLAFVDNGIGSEEDKVLRQIVKELNISNSEYESIVHNFENMMKNKSHSVSPDEAYKILGIKESDDMPTIKKAYRRLIREYHPDIISSQDKGESYMEEATAKTQEINQAYQTIKELRK